MGNKIKRNGRIGLINKSCRNFGLIESYLVLFPLPDLSITGKLLKVITPYVYYKLSERNRRNTMATPIDPKQIVSFEELLMSQVVQQEALTRLLIEKGIFTQN